MGAGSGVGTTWSPGSDWSAAVVYSPCRAWSASGGSETQQHQATSGRLANGASMLTSPPDDGRMRHWLSAQTKSLGPRLATITTRGLTPAAACHLARRSSVRVGFHPG